MTIEIPQYGLKAYALLFSKHGVREEFRQSALDWIVSISMKKKIFSLLLRSGWIKKHSSSTYTCVNPSIAIKGLLDFRVPQIMAGVKKEYAFTRLSAIEIWSDFSYVQRSMEKSPYFIRVFQKDLAYWKAFFNSHQIQNYVESGASIGEYVIFIPVKSFLFEEKNGLRVDPLKETIRYARSNEVYAYASKYMERAYGA